MKSFLYGAVFILMLLGGAIAWLWTSKPATMRNFTAQMFGEPNAESAGSGGRKHWFSVCAFQQRPESSLKIDGIVVTFGIVFTNESAGVLRVMDYDFGSLLDPQARKIDESIVAMGDVAQISPFEMRPGGSETVIVAQIPIESSKTLSTREIVHEILPEAAVFGIYYLRPVLGNKEKHEAEYFRLDDAPSCEDNRSHGR